MAHISCAAALLTVCVTAGPASAAIRVTQVPGTSSLNAVACPTSRTCVVVGEAGQAPATTAVVVPAPGGRPGAPEPVSSSTGFGDLFGIACDNPTTCYAAGQTLVAPEGSVTTITGGVPSQTAMQGEGSILGVACAPGADACVVVGYTNEDTPPRAMAYGLAGGTLGEPVTGLTIGDKPTAVACSSASACVAVGLIAPNGTSVPNYEGLVETIDNGTLGAEQALPDALLSGIACTSSTSCLAVGYYAGEGLLLPIEDGTPGAPIPVPGTASLSAISCATAGRCVAVGSAINGEGAFLRIHDGIPRTTRYVPGTQGLGGVACPNTTRCVMSGSTPDGVGVVATLKR